MVFVSEASPQSAISDHCMYSPVFDIMIGWGRRYRYTNTLHIWECCHNLTTLTATALIIIISVVFVLVLDGPEALVVKLVATVTAAAAAAMVCGLS